ncbi:PH domain-containing protein [Natrinema salifodinae]|uniref:PH domain-containing protein n=1 Tax=Natrinema salifodinae TaxID=1202768 RepID=A0A1I0QMF6_9EURY|nr:PH domain-containing protein [Natrinema salifodinae]SEW28263.1 PH domain-containing protein [Natrinema salifodinae]
MALGSTPDWFHISDDENIVWESRPHPITMGARLPVGVALALAGFVVTGWSATDGVGLLTLLGLLATAAGAALAVARYLVWTNTRYVITSSELYKKRGIVSRDVTQFRLERVQNTSLSQSGIGRLLGYGDLTVYTAGSGDPELTFERVPNPDRASSRLSDQLEAVATDRDPRTV